MGATRYTASEKARILKLIQASIPYSTIQKQYRVPKSTLSTWAAAKGEPRDRSRQLAHLRVARAAATASIKRKKDARVAAVNQTAEKLANAIPIMRKEVAKSLLAMLYWAEGGKQEGNMKFTNTDPELVSLFVSLLRKSYQVDENRLHVALQIHSYHQKTETLTFWSKKLQIPVAQFWKVYLKPRSGHRRYRRNFYGICNLHYASTPIQRELIALGRALATRACS